MAPQLARFFGGGSRPPTREEEVESARRRNQARAIMEERQRRPQGSYTDQPRVPGYILVDGQWVPDPNYQQEPPAGAAAILPGLAGQSTTRQADPSISDLVPPIEAIPDRTRSWGEVPGLGVPVPPPPTQLRRIAGQGVLPAQEAIPPSDQAAAPAAAPPGAMPPWLEQIGEQQRAAYARREQELATLGPEIAGIEQQRQEVMQPAERPKGAGALIEALFSLGSTGDVFDIRNARERKRQKAFNLLNMQRQELIDKQAGLRTRQETAADRFRGEYEREREFDRLKRQTDAAIKNAEGTLALRGDELRSTDEWRADETAHKTRVADDLESYRSDSLSLQEKIAIAEAFSRDLNLRHQEEKFIFEQTALEAERDAIAAGEEMATDEFMAQMEQTQELIADMIWEGRFMGEMGGAVGLKIIDPSRWFRGYDEQLLGGTESAAYDEKLKMLKARLSLSAIETLGGSRRTNLLLGQVMDSVSGLSRSQSKGSHLNRLKQVRQQLYEAMGRLAPDRMANYDLMPLAGDYAGFFTKYLGDTTYQEALADVYDRHPEIRPGVQPGGAAPLPSDYRIEVIEEGPN